MTNHKNPGQDRENTDPLRSGESKEAGRRWKFLNFEYLQEIAPGNYDFFSEMMTAFRMDSLNFLRKMSDQFSRRDFISLAKTAHAMKPTGTYLGMNSLSELVAVLEKEAVSGNNDSVGMLVKQVEEMVTNVNAEIEEYLKAA